LALAADLLFGLPLDADLSEQLGMSGVIHHDSAFDKTLIRGKDVSLKITALPLMIESFLPNLNNGGDS
jgi:hypothetical protein